MQSYYKIWMHFVWTTYRRQKLINNNMMQSLSKHIIENGKEKGYYIDSINGVLDHIHLLVRLTPTQNSADCANLLKGESSNWVNKNNFIKGKFSWQKGYGVFSVSESQVNKVRNYILNQEDHHRKKSYQEELASLLKHFGLD